jgi:glycosyltransferase involved in cell wall biosynthesis
MRILQIAPLWESVPPRAYGGTEAVVHLLCEELVRLGHDVTLCASGDSTTSARLKSFYPFSLRTADWIECKNPYSWQHSALSLKGADGYDIVHNHGGEEVMALAHLVPGARMLTTMHCLITPDTRTIWHSYERHYNTISHAQARSIDAGPRARFAGVAYNGIDVSSFPFSEQKDDHLLFLARISREKGPHLAIEAARRTGKRLIMAGKVDPADREFFNTVIEPQIDGRQIVYVGEADAGLKRKLYKNASCALMPIIWDEPFGLVMAEAQACGTPVIAFNRGAAPEIVRNEQTGFVVEDVDQMVAAIGRAGEIRPVDCRSWVESEFDAPAMARRYLEIYEDILAPAGRPTVPAEYVASSNGHRDPVGSSQLA